MEEPPALSGDPTAVDPVVADSPGVETHSPAVVVEPPGVVFFYELAIHQAKLLSIARNRLHMWVAVGCSAMILLSLAPAFVLDERQCLSVGWCIAIVNSIIGMGCGHAMQRMERLRRVREDFLSEYPREALELYGMIFPENQHLHASV